MSVWTHVNASFRLDNFGKIEDEKIIEVFGKQVTDETWCEMEYDEDLELKNKEKYLPIGSEGSLKMSVWHNPEENHLSSATVSVFGDLRDFDSFKEIKNWFKKCCGSFMIRQASCQVEVEGKGSKVFYYDNDTRKICGMALKDNSKRCRVNEGTGKRKSLGYKKLGLGAIVYCIFEDEIVRRKIEFVGSNSFLVEDNEFYYSEYEKNWFTDLQSAKDKLTEMLESGELYEDYELGEELVIRQFEDGVYRFVDKYF